MWSAQSFSSREAIHIEDPHLQRIQLGIVHWRDARRVIEQHRDLVLLGDSQLLLQFVFQIGGVKIIAVEKKKKKKGESTKKKTPR